MTSPIDGSAPYAPPPKYPSDVMGLREWQIAMDAHQRWLDSTRTTSAGEAGGGETESEQTGTNDNDETNEDTNPSEENPTPMKTNKRQDSGKPGTFNVYAADDKGRESRVAEQVEADSPIDAIAEAQQAMMDEGITDPCDLQNWRATRLRGSSVKSDQTAKLDGNPEPGQGEASPSDEKSDKDGQGQSQDPQPDDIILHRLQSAPLIGQEAEQKIAEIAEQAVSPQLEEIAKTVGTQMAESIKAPAIDEDKVKAIVEQIIKDTNISSTQTIKYQPRDKPEVTLTGHFHPIFSEALRVLSHSKPLYLYGPSGTGKTFMAEQLAGALFPDIPYADRYYGISATMGMSESQLQGWRLPLSAGEFVYVPAEFVKRFENGGLFLLDEADRADPNVLAVLNQAIANKRMPLPTRFEKPFAIMHKNFRIMCAGNTAGTGADRLYTAATRLDEAFLDRFRAGTLFMDYDTKLEQSLVGDTLLLRCMHRMRDKAKTLRIERVVSTRVICDLHDLYDGTSKKDTTLALKRLQGTWEPAEVAKVDPKAIMQEVAA